MVPPGSVSALIIGTSTSTTLVAQLALGPIGDGGEPLQDLVEPILERRILHQAPALGDLLGDLLADADLRRRVDDLPFGERVHVAGEHLQLRRRPLAELALGIDARRLRPRLARRARVALLLVDEAELVVRRLVARIERGGALQALDRLVEIAALVGVDAERQRRFLDVRAPSSTPCARRPSCRPRGWRRRARAGTAPPRDRRACRRRARAP